VICEKDERGKILLKREWKEEFFCLFGEEEVEVGWKICKMFVCKKKIKI
jgi:hypothetical protein